MKKEVEARGVDVESENRIKTALFLRFSFEFIGE